jgi:hypothetical protein
MSIAHNLSAADPSNFGVQQVFSQWIQIVFSITDPNIPAQEADHGETGSAPGSPQRYLLRPVGTAYQGR